MADKPKRNAATIVFLFTAAVASVVAMALLSPETQAYSNLAGSSQEVSCEKRALQSHETNGPVLAVIDGIAYGYALEDSKHYFYAMDAFQGSELWRYQTGDVVETRPAVAGGMVYFGSNDNHLYALDAATGKSLAWRFRTGDDLVSGIEEAGGRVFAKSKDKFLYALDAATGSLLWEFDTEYSAGPQAKVAGGVVYVAYVAGSRLIALDATTGDLLWVNNDINVSSQPAVFGKTVYASYYVLKGMGRRYGTYALDIATGEQLWSGDFISSIPSVSDGVVYSGSSRTVTAEDEATGADLWQYSTDGIVTGTVVHGDTVYVVTHEGFLYALDKHTSALQWECPMGGGDSGWHGFQNLGALVFIWTGYRLSAIGVPELPGELPSKSTPAPRASEAAIRTTVPGQPSPATGSPAAPLPTPTPRPTAAIGEPTINFHASSTEVERDAPINLTLSVANSITQPEMTLQLVLQLPTGVVIIGGEGLDAAATCTTQCSVTYKIPTGENRDFILTAVANSPGPYEVEGHVVWFFGDAPSISARKRVALPFTVVDPPELSAPTVNLHATQTEVNIGSPIVLNLAADNSIAKPEMTLKFILQAPSGWSVSGAGFTAACSGQCTATYKVPSGAQRSINIEMMPNQAGSFDAVAEMEWYFGEDLSTLTRDTKTLALRVLEPPEFMPTAVPVIQEPPSGIPFQEDQLGNGGVCGLSPAGAPNNGAGDMALLALPLLGMAGVLGWRRHRHTPP